MRSAPLRLCTAALLLRSLRRRPTWSAPFSSICGILAGITRWVVLFGPILRIVVHMHDYFLGISGKTRAYARVLRLVSFFGVHRSDSLDWLGASCCDFRQKSLGRSNDGKMANLLAKVRICLSDLRLQCARICCLQRSPRSDKYRNSNDLILPMGVRTFTRVSARIDPIRRWLLLFWWRFPKVGPLSFGVASPKTVHFG